MPRSQKQKDGDVLRRRFYRSYQTVGKFLTVWNLTEAEISRSISAILGTSPIESAIVIANLNFQSKVSILYSLLLWRLRNEPEDYSDKVQEALNRLLNINTEWRNVVVHIPCTPRDDGTFQFSRFQAKRGVKMPPFIKTKTDFDVITDEIFDLGKEVARLRKLAIKAVAVPNTVSTSQEPLSLANLHLQWSHLLGNQHSPLPSPAKDVQGAASHQAKRLVNKKQYRANRQKARTR